MNQLEISVVMSVYNGAKYLRESIESILSQEGVNFEFIIIDDGSIDNSTDILEEFAKKDNRIRLFHQENQGLTKALIRGCGEAKGEFIARQDCGDVSLPGRLNRQLDYLRNHSNVALLSCWSEAIGPEGESLFINQRYETAKDATKLLQTTNIKELKGIPHHATAMFQRELYERVGGYRWQFYYAQDLDLCRRLTNYGLLDFVPEVLYRYRILPESVSGCMTKEQRRITDIILQLNRNTVQQNHLLEKAAKICPPKKPYSRFRVAKGNYFIGKLLAHDADHSGRKYLMQAIRLNPFFLRAWYALAIRSSGIK